MINSLEFENKYVESLEADTIAEIMKITGKKRAHVSWFVKNAIEIRDPAARVRAVRRLCPPPEYGFMGDPIEYEKKLEAKSRKVAAIPYLPAREQMAAEDEIRSEIQSLRVWLEPSPIFTLDEEPARRVYDLINELGGEALRLRYRVARAEAERPAQ